jgi:hypothetical protein
VLGEAKEIYVIRDQGGREVTSDRVYVSTIPSGIPDDQLIAGGYCADAASCAAFKDGFDYAHHYSWDVVFQRTNLSCTSCGASITCALCTVQVEGVWVDESGPTR